MAITLLKTLQKSLNIFDGVKMAKKVWDLKHSKITLTSNRREIIVEYKDDDYFKSARWSPLKHFEEDYDHKDMNLKGWTKYLTIGCYFIQADGESVGVFGNPQMFEFLKYWVNHTGTYKKCYGYFNEDIPSYVLQSLDCYLLDDFDWKPEEYKLSRCSYPKNTRDIIKEYVPLEGLD